MALTDDNSMVMPVAPMYGNGGGFGDGFGGSGWWVLLLFILLGGNGWGNGFGGGYGGNDLYPWMNQSNQINGGFRDQMLNTSISGIQNSITSGFGDVQTALCGGFAGVTNQMYANQIADMERSYAAQTANTQGMTALQAQLSQCCCDNRAATADLKYTVATENCNDRTQSIMNTRDIIDSQNRVGQSILDKLCQLEIDGVRRELAAEQRENANLRSDLMYARGQASQVEQTAQLRANQATVANQLVSELRSCPIPSQPVYGNQPIFNCSGPTFGNTGCGCNGFGFAA